MQQSFYFFIFHNTTQINSGNKLQSEIKLNC